MANRKRKKPTINQIRESLIDQLKSRGADVACFIDLIDSYIYYTEQERLMQEDIRANGLSYPAVSATGKNYIKDNPCIKNAVLYNKQKLAILAQLGLSIDKIESDEDDEL